LRVQEDIGKGNIAMREIITYREVMRGFIGNDSPGEKNLTIG
jgi:hypothetical protein